MSVIVFILGLALLGCGAESSTDSPDAPQSSAMSEGAETGQSTDTGRGSDEASPSGAAFDRSVYPPGPYGVEEGAIAQNLSFLTADDTQLSFQDVRADVSNRYLLIFGTAAWCNKCEKHMPSIKSFHDTYGPQGLVLVATLFEDRTYSKPVARELKAYGRRYDLPIPVLGDGEQQIVSFFGQPNMPMVLLFNLDTMATEYIGYKWDEATIEPLLKARF